LHGRRAVEKQDSLDQDFGMLHLSDGLFLDGTPSMQPLELKVSRTVKGMLESDLALEVSAVKQYNDAVQIATREGDNGSRDLLVQLLKDEESHVDWLEAQLHQIDEMGYERYLTQQVGDNEEEK
jgi:bacterioferritin